MCLSKVYIDERSDENLVLGDVARVAESDGTVEVNTLFGDDKVLEGYTISEVDLTKNFVILKKKEDQ